MQQNDSLADGAGMPAGPGQCEPLPDGAELTERALPGLLGLEHGDVRGLPLALQRDRTRVSSQLQ